MRSYHLHWRECLPPKGSRRNLSDAELGEAEDNRIWAYAKQVNAIIITKDEYFIVLASFDSNGPPIVWVRLGNTTKQALLIGLNHFYPLSYLHWKKAINWWSLPIVES